MHVLLSQVLSDDNIMASMCLTEKRNALAADVGDGAFLWPSAGSGSAETSGRQRRSSSKGSFGDEDEPSLSPMTPLPPLASQQASIAAVERMVQSYEREMSSIESALREMEDNLDAIRCVCRAPCSSDAAIQSDYTGYSSPF